MEGRVEGFVVGREGEGRVDGLDAGREEPEGRVEGRDCGRWTLLPVAGLRRAELLPPELLLAPP